MSKSSGGRKTPRRTPRVHTFLLAALLCTLSPCLCPAASPPSLRVEALVGFNGAVRLGRYAPLVVSLDNQGPELTVRIAVEVSAASGMGGQALWRTLTRTVPLPRSGSRRISFALPVPFSPRGLAVRVLRVEPGGKRRTAAAGAEGTELARQDVDLRGLAAGDRLFAVVASELAFDSLAMVAAQGEQVRVAYPHPQNLPESWAAYDCVDAVIVRDTASLRLKASQVSALEQWVYSGGTLVFTGGAPALMLAAAGFGDLVPVEVTGLAQGTRLSSLASYLGIPRPPSGPVGLARSRVRTGDVLVEEAGIPTVVSRRFGSGRIWFLAFDCSAHALASWEGMGSLWAALTGPDAPTAILRDDTGRVADDPWMKPLLAAPAFAFPSPLAVLAFSLVYIGIFLLLVAPKPFGAIRAPLRGVLLVAIPLLASAAGYLLFSRVGFDPRRLLADAARVDCVAGDGRAVVTEKVGLVSASGPVYGIEVGRRTAALVGSSPSGLLVDEGAAGSTGPIAITGETGARFAGALLTLASVIDFPLDARLSVEGEELRLMVSNATAVHLDGAFLAMGGMFYSVGSIPPGAVERRTFTRSDAVQLPGPLRGAPGIPADAPAVGLWAQAFTAADREKTVLVAWSRQSPLGVRPERGAPRPRIDPLAMVVLEMR